MSFAALEAEGRRGMAMEQNTWAAEAVAEAGAAEGRRAKHRPPQPTDVATFCYTSGTTGDPKGALITHQNLVAAVANLEVSDVDDFGPEDVHFSYLPLPHIFERVMQINCFAFGAAVGFYQGDTLKLVEDLVALKPSIFPSVPRVLNRLYDKITAGVSQSFSLGGGEPAGSALLTAGWMGGWMDG